MQVSFYFRFFLFFKFQCCFENNFLGGNPLPQVQLFREPEPEQLPFVRLIDGGDEGAVGDNLQDIGIIGVGAGAAIGGAGGGAIGPDEHL